jgi:hypothetical protein
MPKTRRLLFHGQDLKSVRAQQMPQRPGRNRLRDKWGSVRASMISRRESTRIGRPVIHFTSGCSANTPPTTNNPLVCNLLLAFSQPIIPLVARANPVFNASYTPLSAGSPTATSAFRIPQ